MYEQERLTPDESEFADAVGALMPAGPELKFQQVWLEAHRRRWRRQVFIWRGVAAVMGAGLVVSLLLRSHETPGRDRSAGREPVREVVHQLPQKVAPVPERQPLPVLLTGNDYLALRSRVLALGIDAIQPPPAAATRANPERPIDGSRLSEPRTGINLFGSFAWGTHS